MCSKHFYCSYFLSYVHFLTLDSFKKSYEGPKNTLSFSKNDETGKICECECLYKSSMFLERDYSNTVIENHTYKGTGGFL